MASSVRHVTRRISISWVLPVGGSTPIAIVATSLSVGLKIGQKTRTPSSGISPSARTRHTRPPMIPTGFKGLGLVTMTGVLRLRTQSPTLTARPSHMIRRPLDTESAPVGCYVSGKRRQMRRFPLVRDGMPHLWWKELDGLHMNPHRPSYSKMAREPSGSIHRRKGGGAPERMSGNHLEDGGHSTGICSACYWTARDKESG